MDKPKTRKKLITELIDDDDEIIKGGMPSPTSTQTVEIGDTDKNYDMSNQKNRIGNIFGLGANRIKEANTVKTSYDRLSDDDFSSVLFPAKTKKETKNSPKSGLFYGEDGNRFFDDKDSDVVGENEGFIEKDVILQNVDIPQIVYMVEELIDTFENSLTFAKKSKKERLITKIAVINTLIDKLNIPKKDEVISQLKTLVGFEDLIKLNEKK